MAMYAIKDTTLTALGDAVRSKTNGPLPIISQTDYKPIDSSKVYKVEMPSYVKRIRFIGTGKYGAKVHSDSNLLGLGVAPGVYEYGFKVRDAEDFTIIFKYIFTINHVLQCCSYCKKSCCCLFTNCT